MILSDCSEPVSYTHLDVYKRQSRYSINQDRAKVRSRVLWRATEIRIMRHAVVRMENFGKRALPMKGIQADFIISLMSEFP